MAAIIVVAFAAVILVGTILAGRSTPSSNRVTTTTRGQVVATLDNAGFAVRLTAAAVDWLLLLIVLIAFRLFLPIPFVGVFVPIGYFMLYWTTSGATPGLKMMRLRVIDADSSQLIGYRRAVLRCVGYVVAGLPLGFGFLWAVWDPEKQGWHDKIAGTRVIRVATAARDKRTIII